MNSESTDIFKNVENTKTIVFWKITNEYDKFSISIITDYGGYFTNDHFGRPKFNSYEEAKLYITQIMKPMYLEYLGNNYILEEVSDKNIEKYNELTEYGEWLWDSYDKEEKKLSTKFIFWKQDIINKIKKWLIEHCSYIFKEGKHS